MRRILAGLAACCLAAIAAPAGAVPIAWTDWTSAGPGVVNGTLMVGATPVAVTYSGAFGFAQTAGGTFYWSEGVPAPYTGSALVDNAPPTSDIIALSPGGTVTVTFGQAIQDPIIALVSWNGNVVNFSTPITILSSGPGHWGAGSFGSVTATGFTGLGELHGAIQLPGSHTSFSFTHTSENWHGLTIGVVGLAQLPEPGALAILGLGLAGLGLARRRARR